MDTQIITNPSDQELDMIARALRNGELVSIPNGYILAWSIDNHIA